MNEQYQYVNLTSIFKEMGRDNRLLQQLKMFNEIGQDSHFFSFDMLFENDQDTAAPVNRYGSDWQYTKRELAKLEQMEMNTFAFMDPVRPSDWQGKRRPGSTEQLTATDVMLTQVRKQKQKAERTIEAMLADSLFRNSVAAPYTQDAVVDNQIITGKSQQTHNIDLTSSTVLVDTEVNKIYRKIKKALGDKSDFLTKVICFAGPTYFDALKSHPSVRALFVNGGTVPDAIGQHVIGNYVEIAAGIQMFVFAGILFVCDDIDVHEIGTNEAFYVPVLKAESGVYSYHYGPAARHGLAAQERPARVHNYSIQDKFAMPEAYTEFSGLPLNLMPAAVVKSSNQA
ncbi:major capsid protein [Aeromonas encheleia]|uniref:Major capsid protein n=1 Tax=Aeromonas encheleia TaxID=73010 RepID=A0AAE9MDQ9_9GAMM|nr:major capsid protein [Aeromonas encheleia]USV55831.1 major capsid protein [Aeromonas encheleia]